MKKLLALTIAMLFLGVGIATAGDVTVTGSYFMRGAHYDNVDGTGVPGDNVKDFQNFDQELTFDVQFIMSPYTKVFTRIEAMDNNMGTVNEAIERTPYAGYGGSFDDNIVVEQVYGQHTFAATKTTLRTGLMGANAWATDFGDAGGEANRIWVMQPSGYGTWFAVYEKASSTGGNNDPSEFGNTVTGEDADKTGYILGLVTKVGSVNVKPLVKYTKAGGSDLNAYAALLGIDGAVNNIGYEAEFVYVSYDFGDQLAGGLMEDGEVFGAYGNMWIQLNQLKLGGLIAYASYDEGAGSPAGTGMAYSMGDNFAAGGALILGDDLFMGGSNDAIAGATVFAAYASYALNEKTTLGAYMGFVDSNIDTLGSMWDGTEAWEVSVTGAYKITNNLTYSVAAGVAEMEYGTLANAGVLEQPDKAVEIHHMLSFSF